MSESKPNLKLFDTKLIIDTDMDSYNFDAKLIKMSQKIIIYDISEIDAMQLLDLNIGKTGKLQIFRIMINNKFHDAILEAHFDFHNFNKNITCERLIFTKYEKNNNSRISSWI